MDKIVPMIALNKLKNEGRKKAMYEPEATFFKGVHQIPSFTCNHGKRVLLVRALHCKDST